MTRDDLLTHDGITQPITEWALDYGILPEIIIARLERGLSVATAITRPMSVAPGQRLPATKQHALYLLDGLTVSQWSQRTGIPVNTLYDRMRSGRTFAEAVAMPYRQRGVASNLDAIPGTGAGGTSEASRNIAFPSEEVSR